MANEHKIEINKRANITRQGLKQLRREGNIPGIYYSERLLYGDKIWSSDF